MLRRVASNAAAQLAGQALGFLERFVLTALLLRAWGPHVYGDWAVLLATIALLSVAELALGIYFGNQWHQAFVQRDEARFRRLVSVSIGVFAVIGGVMAAGLLMFLALRNPAAVYGLVSVGLGESFWIFALLGAGQVVFLLRGAISQIYRGRGQFALGMLVGLGPTALYLLGAMIAALLAASPVVIAGVWLCAQIVGTGWMAADIALRYPGILGPPAWPRLPEWKAIGAATPWNALLQGAPVLLLQIPTLLLAGAGVAGAALAGFVLMRTIASYLRSLATILALSVGTEIAALVHQEDLEAVRRHLATAGRMFGILAGIAGAAAIVWGASLLRLLSGDAGLYDPMLMGLLLIAAGLGGASSALQAVFMYAGRARPVALAGLVQIAVTIVGVLALAPQYGALGAAAALVLGEAVTAILLMPLAGRRHFGLPYHASVGGGLTALVAAAAWGSAIAFGISMVISAETLWGLAVSGIAYFILGLAPAMAFGAPASLRRRVSARLGLR